MQRTLTTAIVVALAAASAGCGDGDDPSLIVASGHVEVTEVRIATKVPGVVVSFPLDEGSHVSEGQEIARVDTKDVDLALAAARAERDQADAQLRLALAGARSEDIAEAEAQVAQARAGLEGAERDLARMEALLARGSGTEKTRDDARTRRDVAAGRLAAAEERLRKLRAGSRGEEKDAARARLDAAEARIAQLGQQVADAVILSPLEGVLTEKLAESGELLSMGSPLAVVADLEDAWLTVYVTEPDLGRIRIGQEAEVVTDDGQRRKGRVTFVASKAEFTPKNVQTRDERVRLVYRIKIGLDNRDGLFKPGMPAEARLRAAGVAV